jgi:competence protein ComEC
LVTAGDSIDLGDGIELKVLSPRTDADLSGNDAGVVLRLSWGDVSFLFAADIQARAERLLVESAVQLEATVLKVAHHGSATSSTDAFLDAVRPAVAVVSSGAGNRFGHPDAGVITRLAEYAAVYNTAERGAIHMETDGRSLWIEPER